MFFQLFTLAILLILSAQQKYLLQLKPNFLMKAKISLNIYITDQNNKQHFALLKIQKFKSIDNALDQLQLCEDYQEIDTLLIPKENLLFFDQKNNPIHKDKKIVELASSKDEDAILFIKKKTVQKRQSVQSKITVANHIYQSQQVRNEEAFDTDGLKQINIILEKLACQRSLTVENIDAQKNLPYQTAKHLRQIVTLINAYRARSNCQSTLQDYNTSPFKNLQNEVAKWKNRCQQSLQKYQNLKSDLISQKNNFVNELKIAKIQIQNKFSREIQFLTREKSELLKTIEDLQFANVQLEESREMLNSKITELKGQISSTLVQTNSSKSLDLASPFLNSSIYMQTLQQQSSKAQKLFFFLKDSLEMQGKIVKSLQKLYQFDPFNKTNFHRYIDGQSNFLVIIKTVKGNLIGGYSEAAFQPEWEHKKSYLFSLTDQKILPIGRDKKPQGISYDPFYIIFGKEQLMIKTCSNLIYSGIGLTKNRCFDAEGSYSFKDFLGEQQNQVQAQTYEILKVIFEQ